MSVAPPSSALLRKAERLAARLVVAHVAVLAAFPANAQQVIGQKLLTYSKNYIIAPVGLLAVVIAVFASIFRPDMVKQAAYTAIICAVLFFIIQNSTTLLQALQ